MNNNIHPTAIVDPAAKLAPSVSVGPYCTIGANVTIGEGSQLISHVVITGHTTIGENNTIYPFASLGQPPQDLKYDGEDTKLVIGNNNTIREYVTISIGTVQDNGVTSIANNNLIMANAHIAHDAIVCNDCVLSQGATLAGHVKVEDNAIIGGLSAVHQYARIGRMAIVGGCSAVVRDVPPFATAYGNHAKLEGLNLVGLRRSDMSRETIKALKVAYKELFTQNGDNLNERIAQVADEYKDIAEVQELTKFTTESKRGMSKLKSAELTNNE